MLKGIKSAVLLTLAMTIASVSYAFAEGKTYNIAIIRWDAGDIFFNGVQYGEEEGMKPLRRPLGIKSTSKWSLRMMPPSKSTD